MECVFAPSARRQILSLRAYDQRRILDAIRKHLVEANPREETRHKLALIPPPEFAEYELRVGDFRVFYRIEETEDEASVIIAVIGWKVHNKLIVDGEEMKI